MCVLFYALYPQVARLLQISETAQISKRQDHCSVKQASGFRFQFSAEDFEHVFDEIMAQLWTYDVKNATVMIHGT
jgi:hypothetical protein